MQLSIMYQQKKAAWPYRDPKYFTKFLEMFYKIPNILRNSEIYFRIHEFFSKNKKYFAKFEKKFVKIRKKLQKTKKFRKNSKKICKKQNTCISNGKNQKILRNSENIS